MGWNLIEYLLPTELRFIFVIEYNPAQVDKYPIQNLSR